MRADVFSKGHGPLTLLPIVIFWALAAAAFFGAPRRLYYLLFATLPFGSFAVIPTQLTAGLTFTAGPILALLIVARMVLSRGGVNFALTAAFTPRRMTLLFLLLVVACTTTLFMPRLFAGEIAVIPIRGILQETAPLVPRTQNLSQLVYLAISILTVVAAAFFLRSAALRQHALRAVCLGAAVTIGTGVVDFLDQYLPLGPLLAPFRTATYALAVDVEVLGGKRVVGLMPEASAFGGLCLAFLSALVFFRFAIADQRLREVYVPILIGALVLMIWLSKSTSAYVGLGLVGGLFAIQWLLRAAGRSGGAGAGRGLITEFWAAMIALLALVLAFLLQPAIFDPIYAVIDRMVFSKATSASFEERGMWRAVAWQAFLDSHLLGIGVGSTRASSAIVSMLSSVGLLGALAYYGFLLQTALRRAAPDDPQGAVIVAAFGWFIVPELVVGFFVGSADFGVFHGVIFGLVTAAGLSRPVRTGAIGGTPSALPARREGGAAVPPTAPSLPSSPS